MMNVSSDYIYDDAILNRPCLSERNEKSKTAKNGPTPLGSRTDSSATDGLPITAEQVDVDALNKYFVEIGVNTSRTVDRSGPELPVRLPRVSTGSFVLAPVTPSHLRSAIGRMNSSSACGADGMCVRFINPRPAGGQILPPLSNIRDNLRTT